MIAFVGYPCVLRNSFLCGDHCSDVTCDGVVTECSRAPVVEFQMWIVASDVPPPDASSDGCHGHHAMACEARVSARSAMSFNRAAHLHRRSVVPLRPARACPCTGRDVADTAIPDVDDVVVSATREQLAVLAPLEAAHLPDMAEELAEIARWAIESSVVSHVVG